jgi:hypothetical protein
MGDGRWSSAAAVDVDVRGVPSNFFRSLQRELDEYRYVASVVWKAH